MPETETRLAKLARVRDKLIAVAPPDLIRNGVGMVWDTEVRPKLANLSIERQEQAKERFVRRYMREPEIDRTGFEPRTVPKSSALSGIPAKFTEGVLRSIERPAKLLESTLPYIDPGITAARLATGKNIVKGVSKPIETARKSYGREAVPFEAKYPWTAGIAEFAGEAALPIPITAAAVPVKALPAGASLFQKALAEAPRALAQGTAIAGVSSETPSEFAVNTAVGTALGPIASRIPGVRKFFGYPLAQTLKAGAVTQGTAPDFLAKLEPEEQEAVKIFGSIAPDLEVSDNFNETFRRLAQVPEARDKFLRIKGKLNAFKAAYGEPNQDQFERILRGDEAVFGEAKAAKQASKLQSKLDTSKLVHKDTFEQAQKLLNRELTDDELREFVKKPQVFLNKLRHAQTDIAKETRKKQIVDETAKLEATLGREATKQEKIRIAKGESSNDILQRPQAAAAPPQTTAQTPTQDELIAAGADSVADAVSGAQAIHRRILTRFAASQGLSVELTAAEQASPEAAKLALARLKEQRDAAVNKAIIDFPDGKERNAKLREIRKAVNAIGQNLTGIKKVKKGEDYFDLLAFEKEVQETQTVTKVSPDVISPEEAKRRADAERIAQKRGVETPISGEEARLGEEVQGGISQKPEGTIFKQGGKTEVFEGAETIEQKVKEFKLRHGRNPESIEDWEAIAGKVSKAVAKPVESGPKPLRPPVRTK